MRSAVAALFLPLLLASAAHARPPPGGDPNSPLGQWRNALTQPRDAISCCALADCRLAQMRLGKDHYWVFVYWVFVHWVFVGKRFPSVPNEWIEVPNDAGQPVACWSPESGLLCFVPGPEA